MNEQMTDEEVIKVLKSMHLGLSEYHYEACRLAIRAIRKLRAVEDVISAEATWIFDEDGNDYHAVLVEDLEEVLKND